MAVGALFSYFLKNRKKEKRGRIRREIRIAHPFTTIRKFSEKSAQPPLFKTRNLWAPMISATNQYQDHQNKRKTNRHFNKSPGLIRHKKHTHDIFIVDKPICKYVNTRCTTISSRLIVQPLNQIRCYQPLASSIR